MRCPHQGFGNAARRHKTPERVTIFTNAQAAIRCMATEEPGPGRMYAIQARRHIVALWKARPEITIEIGWCRPAKESQKTRRLMSGPS